MIHEHTYREFEGIFFHLDDSAIRTRSQLLDILPATNLLEDAIKEHDTQQLSHRIFCRKIPREQSKGYDFVVIRIPIPVLQFSVKNPGVDLPGCF
jgi:hypothetical protein